ncbi:MAG: acyltransferase [Proteobacteria bacterium]|nr:acyltransferase [Pseudomonadota bacterium]MBI3495805.1 acyltransferase [Pseudomonadota bacterium]
MPSGDIAHRNNLDLLRLVFAITVFLVHGYVLSGKPELSLLGTVLSTDIAVKSFFVVSGLLIFRSYERSSGLFSYAAKRARRIYPAYVASVLFFAAVLYAVSEASPGAYFSVAWLNYAAWNLVFLNFLDPRLPGVFVHNAWQEVNGALWTLKVEVMFYAAVPLIIFIFRRIGVLVSIVFLYISSVAYAYGMLLLSGQYGSPLLATLAHQLPGQISYFVSGAFIYYYFDMLKNIMPQAAMAAMVLLIVDSVSGIHVFEPFALAILISTAAFYVYLGNFGKYGDFSFGVYIIHFPILQALVQLGLFDYSPYGALALAAGLVGGGAFLLWRLVEEPFLARASHYIAATEPGRDAPRAAS